MLRMALRLWKITCSCRENLERLIMYGNVNLKTTAALHFDGSDHPVLYLSYQISLHASVDDASGDATGAGNAESRIDLGVSVLRAGRLGLRMSMWHRCRRSASLSSTPVLSEINFDRIGRRGTITPRRSKWTDWRSNPAQAGPAHELGHMVLADEASLDDPIQAVVLPGAGQQLDCLASRLTMPLAS